MAELAARLLQAGDPVRVLHLWLEAGQGDLRVEQVGLASRQCRRAIPVSPQKLMLRLVLMLMLTLTLRLTLMLKLAMVLTFPPRGVQCSQETLGLSAIIGSVGVIRSTARVREAGQGRRLRPRRRWLQVRDHRGQGQVQR